MITQDITQKTISKLMNIIAQYQERLATEHETNVEYSNAINDLTGQLRSLQQHQSETEAEFNRTVSEKDKNIEELKNLVSNREALVNQVLCDISNKNSQIKSRDELIWRMQHGLVMQLMTRFKAVLDRILIPGSKPRRLYEMSMEAIRIIMSQGLAAFWIIFKRKLRMIAGNSRGAGLHKEKVKAAACEEVSRACKALSCFEPSAATSIQGTKAGANILFYLGCTLGESKRYRVFNVIEYLTERGFRSTVIDDTQIIRAGQELDKFDVIVLMRAAMSPQISNLISYAKSLNIPVVYEVDDYIFEPSIVPDIDGVKYLTEEGQKQYIEGVHLYRDALMSCDYAITPTAYLSQRISELGVLSFVIPNGLSKRQVEIGDRVFRNKKRSSVDIVIGYFSGTHTHNADFAQTADALLRILEEYIEVKLLIVGPLDIDQRFNEYKKRIIRKKLVTWDELPDSMHDANINIVPLERGNAFCEAKSELKFIDASMLSIPTIASATDTYASAIKDGETGFLVYTKDEWYACIKKLLDDPVLRQKTGGAANKYVMDNYSTGALAEKAQTVISSIQDDYKSNKNKTDGVNKLSIGWVIPTPFEASGGLRNIFRVARFLSKFGHKISIYAPAYKFASSYELAMFVYKEYGKIDAYIQLGTDNIRECDALFATHFSTVDAVMSNRQQVRKMLYFVQDFEPYFVPMSYEYIKAENTYKMGLSIITSGPWCANMMQEKWGIEADYFRFPVDRNIYFPRDDVGREKYVVIFFARPEMPRRLFPLGIQALRILKEKLPEVKIILFGSNAILDGLDLECENLGAVSDLNELAKLYSRATLGLAFSTTNPSLIPFEMMACKCPVVDVDYGNNDLNYGSRDNVLLTYPDAEGVSEGMLKLLSDAKLREQIAMNGHQYAQTFPDEEEVARTIEKFVLKKVKGG